jgi:hypothetical protein
MIKEQKSRKNNIFIIAGFNGGHNSQVVLGYR